MDTSPAPIDSEAQGQINTTLIRRAVEADLDAAADILAQAFAEYAWTRWTIPAENYASRLEELQRLYLAYALEHGLVFVDERVRSVSAFLPSNPPPMRPEVEERIGALHGERLGALMELSLPAAPEGSWTLATVGVRPDNQGLGLGTAVTEAGLQLLDDRRCAVALETSDERNVRLYRKLGFVLDETTSIPDGLLVYSMSRPAR